MCHLCDKIKRLSMNGVVDIMVKSCGKEYSVTFFPDSRLYNTQHRTVSGKCIEEVIDEAITMTKIDELSEKYLENSK